MLVFISQPMKNLSDEEITSVRKQLQKDFSNQFTTEPIVYIDSFFPLSKQEDIKDKSNIALYMFSKSISKMSECDTIVFADGWQYNRGCRLEFDIAKQYGLNIYTKTIKNDKVIFEKYV